MQEAFYSEFFKKLIENREVEAKEITGWSERTMRQWRARLKDLNIIETKKRGKHGVWYHKWHPKLLGKLNEWWKQVGGRKL